MKRFFERISYIFKYRIGIFAVVFAVLFTILIVHLFNIQIINGSKYSSGLNASIEKVVATPASRGRIFDRNGVVLAYDDIVYAVNISDSGSYSNLREKNAAINSTIIKTLRLVEKNGDHYYNDFSLENVNGHYRYTVGGDSLLRFLRDCYGVASVNELKDNQKTKSADELVNDLIKNYQVDVDGLNATTNELIELLYLRVNMTANSYTRYRSFTIANEVSEKTMSAILESSGDLTGVTVDQKNVRRYNDTKYYSGIIGYTGVVSDEQLSEKDASGNNKYETTDYVGKTGIEQVLENDLAGQKGKKTVYLDTVGRITEVLKENKSIAGHDVYLTIDSRLQKKLYDSIEDKLTEIIIDKLRSGGAKYQYENGAVKDIYILMPEVIYGLVKNNLVRLSSLENPKTDLERSINSAYTDKKDGIIKWLSSEMLSDGTKYETLDDEHKEYVWGVYKFLVSNEIIKTDVINTDDPKYKAWISGSGLSLTEFIKYAFASNWIDISKISTEKYTDINDIYRELVKYVESNYASNRDFALSLYKFMIRDGEIAQTDICKLLYEQGYLNKDSDLYNSLSGGMSAQGFIVSALKSKVLTPGELGLYPSSGGGIVEDPKTGQLLAMVSYPGYNSNKLTGNMDVGYYNSLQYNTASPMLNWAIQATCAPGSIFKMNTAITALEEGVASPDTSINCTGVYTDVTPNPRCWIYPGSHGLETMPTAIRDSCNIYFYTMGNLLARKKDGTYDSDYGTTLLKKYSDRLGLSTKSGIELPETEPRASDSSAIFSAIGQGTATYSCVNIARYVTTITNEGTCYNSNVVLKITDHDGNVISETKPTVSNTMKDIKSDTWATVKEGMSLATGTYEALRKYSGTVACKTGTSQPSELQPDNATFVSYAPLNDPEITLSIEIPFGYTSINNTQMAASFYDYYFEEYKTGVPANGQQDKSASN